MIEILCSGVSLGVYVPGLLIRERLRALGIPARVVVYESFLSPERQARIGAAKRANCPARLNSEPAQNT